MQNKPIIVLASALLLAGCSNFGFPGVYRINIEQGNIVTQEMVDQLRPGMTRRQVRFIMGTPMIADTFDQDRWDYLYSLQTPRGKHVEKHMSLFFKGDLLTSFQGDFLPADADTVSAK